MKIKHNKNQSIDVTFFILLIMAVFSTVELRAQVQMRLDYPIDDTKQLKLLKSAVEKYPDSLRAHMSYIDAMGALNPELPKQYDVWLKKFSKSAIVPLALGDTLSVLEDPGARKYLLLAVERNPKLARAYYRLAFDADRWGDAKGYSDYMGKAAENEPDNPHYNLYYASSLKKFDREKWKQQSLLVAKKFADHQRGKMAMFLLADYSDSVSDKIKYLQMLREGFDPASSWYRVGMENYLDILMDSDPQKAIELAKEMAARPQYAKGWSLYLKNAELIAEGKKNLASNPAKALEYFNGVAGFYPTFKINKKLPILKASALEKIGQTDSAYNSLITFLVKTPASEIYKSILDYGKKLNKGQKSIKEDIDNKLYANASQATDFRLTRYGDNVPVSLSDYKGKAILLTYWFPGCGPCRAEFPHFENVVQKYKDKPIAYLAINIDSRQNDYVLPFLNKTGYSFTSLEELKDRKKGNLDNGRQAPVNFLIDKSGKILFSRFRINGENEDELAMMFELATDSE